jgi:2-amino-4-hydroxy-6-hydroxymethyldihydropteridine diphosphokinase/dihydropteroate synthase
MIYLGLGSNLGNRRDFLARALAQLAQGGFKVSRVSPVVESPALLKKDALPEWDRPYLNLVAEGQTLHSPEDMLRLAKTIELALGRDLSASRWSPRNIDIDLLLWNDEKINTPDLVIPHVEMHKRSFVITPLMHLAPHLIIPGIKLSPLQISRQIRPIPLWMGVANITPDSFSGGGQVQTLAVLEAQFETWIEAGVQILDIGGESTRPGANSLSWQDDWSRLNPVLEMLARLRLKHELMPLISVDTRHAKVAQKALEKGASWVNDVTGLSDPEMQALIAKQKAGVIAMHSLSIPVKPGEMLDTTRPVDQQLLQWLDIQSTRWQNAGLDFGRIIFDPGVGFGKSALQNQEIIKSTASLRQHGFRLLVGHSRKSFMNGFTSRGFADRDIETLGLSLAMCEQGVDIIRVHDPLSHIRAYRAWAQIRAI